MSYELYQTEGIVLKSREVGDADKILSVFTKDFGRIELAVKSARRPLSKLNPHLNLYDYSRFAFVAGKEFWRLVDAEKISSWPNIGKDELKISSFAAVVRFLEKMLRGEEKNGELWHLVKNVAVFLNGAELEKEDLKVFEGVAMFRSLFLLGYVDNSTGISAELTANGEFNQDFLKKYRGLRPRILKIVRESVTASDL